MSVKIKVINSFEGADFFYAEGKTLTEALEHALNQLGYQSYYVKEG